ncbi:hypothetical protein [Guptibacillus hwajinpoensis]|uniref:hypothetical protein n=1 Tax=Guptibacillus hwajinpoensis TaxID=208199 RepID=UPI001F1D7400|nr:hypothetical protein [Alkalihalobacillus macyae]
MKKMYKEPNLADWSGNPLTLISTMITKTAIKMTKMTDFKSPSSTFRTALIVHEL